MEEAVPQIKRKLLMKTMLNEELEVLNNEARELEDRIAENVAKIQEGA
jgi:hypothetical protein